MKRILTSFIFMLACYAAMGQILDKNPEENEIVNESVKQNVKEKEKTSEIQTIFGNNKSFGGYGSVYLNYTQVDKIDAIETGARIAFIISHSLALGFEGAGFVSNVVKERHINREYVYAGGYGGFCIEPILYPKFPVHVSFPVMLGVGAVTYGIITANNNDDIHMNDADVFLVARPGVELEFNVTRFFRISLNGYYRFTTNVMENIDYMSSSRGMDGYSFGIHFKIGKF